MTTDTKRLRRIGHAVALELDKDTGELIQTAADDIERLRTQTAHETLVAKAATEEVERLRGVLKLAYDAMNYMGDVLNGMDTVEDEDEDATTPAFEAVRAALQEPKC